MKILIAEDERITLKALQRQLSRWGHEVVAVEDGVLAWEEFQRQEFDIVVTDWDMPRMDGRELIQHIRSSTTAGYAYLIMLTGRSETADLVVGMEAGADDFLAKPFDRNELHVRLNAGERIIRLERKLATRNRSLSAANERMKRDLDAAAEMQRGLLPNTLLDNPDARFEWHFDPCDELGGDILNVVPLDEHTIAMYLLDVSGHGVPAALLSVTLSRVLTAKDTASSILLASDNGEVPIVRTPREVAENLNRQFPIEEQSWRFFTMVYAVLDTRSRVLRYVVAGHPPPLLVRHTESCRQLEGRNLPIGVIDDAAYEDHSIQLEPGDRVYFYSDGVTEAFNAADELLDIEGFMRLIDCSRTGSLEKDVVKCVENLKRWCHSVPPKDDVSLLVLEIPC